MIRFRFSRFLLVPVRAFATVLVLWGAQGFRALGILQRGHGNRNLFDVESLSAETCASWIRGLKVLHQKPQPCHRCQLSAALSIYLVSC